MGGEHRKKLSSSPGPEQRAAVRRYRGAEVNSPASDQWQKDSLKMRLKPRNPAGSLRQYRHFVTLHTRSNQLRYSSRTTSSRCDRLLANRPHTLPTKGSYGRSGRSTSHHPSAFPYTCGYVRQVARRLRHLKQRRCYSSACFERDQREEQYVACRTAVASHFP